MQSPQERASRLWYELTTLIPFDTRDYDYQALASECQSVIAKALVPPIDKTEAFDQFFVALDAAGVMDKAPIIEALYTYREALLKWQREVIDSKARDAELAIRALRGYTRSNE